MRRARLGLLVMLGTGLVMALSAGRVASEPAAVAAYGRAETAPTASPTGELITHAFTADGQPHTLTVIDPRRRVVGVYHVDRATGELALKSVRNITWDLQMIEFNSGSPLPQDIRGGLQR